MLGSQWQRSASRDKLKFERRAAFVSHMTPRIEELGMPIYEYTCQDCERQVELLVRGSERPVCPECGSEQLEKLLSVPAAHTSGEKSLPIAGDGFRPCGMGGCGRPECE